MSKPEKFDMAIPLCAVSLLFLLSCSSSVTAQVDASTQAPPIQVSLKLDKKTIMIGEPLFIAFEVTNVSGETLCLEYGGDYRNRFGRPERFSVSVKSEDGAAIPNPEAFGFGGLSGCNVIKDGETYTVKLFLSHWANIERTGSYSVNVKRQMQLSNYEDPPRKRQYSLLADVNADFVVVPYDQNKMGGVISSLGSIMLDSSDPRAVDSAQALASIQDERVTTYFAEALSKFGDSNYYDFPGAEFSISSRAIDVLATYDDDRALEALKSVMNSQSDETRLKVATAFKESSHKAALKLLLQMQNDSFHYVRLRVEICR